MVTLDATRRALTCTFAAWSVAQACPRFRRCPRVLCCPWCEPSRSPWSPARRSPRSPPAFVSVFAFVFVVVGGAPDDGLTGAGRAELQSWGSGGGGGRLLTLWRVPLYVAPGLPRPTSNQVPSRATTPLRPGRRIHLGRRSCTHCRTLMPSALKPLAPHTQQIAAAPSRGFVDRSLRSNGARHRERCRAAALDRRGRPNRCMRGDAYPNHTL